MATVFLLPNFCYLNPFLPAPFFPNIFSHFTYASMIIFTYVYSQYYLYSISSGLCVKAPLHLYLTLLDKNIELNNKTLALNCPQRTTVATYYSGRHSLLAHLP